MAEGVFPIIDRDTPVIDRIRERRNGTGDKSVDSVADALGESLMLSEDEREDLSVELTKELIPKIADKLDVEESQLNEEAVKELADEATGYTVGEILTPEALEELGLEGRSLEQIGEEAEDDDEFDAEEAAERMDDESNEKF